MNIENALKIEGWMDPPDLHWLARKAATHSRIVEVGSWNGRSTAVLADNSPGTVWAVDHWQGSDEHRNSLIDSDPVLFQDFCERAYGRFTENMKPYIESGKVIPVKMDSVKAAAIFSGQGQIFDMVFIDANHQYEYVKADILAWKPLCKGLFCGHDAGHGPVMQALGELLPGYHNECSMWVLEL